MVSLTTLFVSSLPPHLISILFYLFKEVQIWELKGELNGRGPRGDWEGATNTAVYLVTFIIVGVNIRCFRRINRIYYRCERREYYITVLRERQIIFLIVELTCYYLLSHVFIAYTILLFINYY